MTYYNGKTANIGDQVIHKATNGMSHAGVVVGFDTNLGNLLVTEYRPEIVRECSPARTMLVGDCIPN